MTEQPEARALFQSAYENRYTWAEDFPGFTTDVAVKKGEETYTGKVRVNSDLTVEVTEIADEKVKESLYTQLRDVITHRKRNTFEKSHGKNSFRFGETDASGSTEILVTGDAMGSNYKVRGQEISQVSRVMGRMAFTIDHKASLDTGSGYVSTNYDAVFRNSQTGDLMREMQFEDTYEKVGDYYLMTRQVIHIHEQGKVTTTEFDFSNIKLLQPAIAQ
jgi:heterodisulfide reductase subunit B